MIWNKERSRGRATIFLLVAICFVLGTAQSGKFKFLATEDQATIFDRRKIKFERNEIHL